jgi:hypothetical protein
VSTATEFSLSQIWVIGGSFGNDLNTIEAGWQVRTYDHCGRRLRTVPSSLVSVSRDGTAKQSPPLLTVAVMLFV